MKYCDVYKPLILPLNKNSPKSINKLLDYLFNYICKGIYIFQNNFNDKNILMLYNIKNFIVTIILKYKNKKINKYIFDIRFSDETKNIKNKIECKIFDFLL
jgi:hypothetical protein